MSALASSVATNGDREPYMSVDGLSGTTWMGQWNSVAEWLRVDAGRTLWVKRVAVRHRSLPCCIRKFNQVRVRAFICTKRVNINSSLTVH